MEGTGGLGGSGNHTGGMATGGFGGGGDGYGSGFNAGDAGWGFGPTRGDMGGDASAGGGLLGGSALTTGNEFSRAMAANGFNPSAAMRSWGDADTGARRAERMAAIEAANNQALALARAQVGDYDGDPFDIAGIDNVRARAAVNMGDVGTLRGLGYNDAAATLSEKFSKNYGGLLSTIGSMFNSKPETVQTPMRSLTEMVRAGYAQPSSDPTTGDYVTTPKLARSVAADFFGGLPGYAVGSIMSGGLMAPAAALSGPRQAIAGMFGAIQAGRKADNAGVQRGDMDGNVASGGQSETTTSSHGDYVVAASPNGESISTIQGDTSQAIDPLAWFKSRR